MKLICIVIPSTNSQSPIKGASALANKLIKKYKILVVTLKEGKSFNRLFDNKIEHLDLSKFSWYKKYLFFLNYLISQSKKYKIQVISYCFSGDVFTSFFKNKCQIISYVRGDLYKVYRLDYGLIGIFYAWLHYEALKKFDFILGLSKVMVEKIEKLTNKKCYLIPNFIDENKIAKYVSLSNNTNKKINLIYVGRLTKLKSVSSIIKILDRLQKEKKFFHLDIVGDGPLREKIKKEISKLNNPELVTLHGFVDNPYPLLAKSNIFILPSKSEGISRSALEALFLGNFCIIRDLDNSAAEYIVNGENGFLFKHDNQLPELIIKASRIIKASKSRKNLLPNEYRQNTCIKRFEVIHNL
ncbi:Glycosyltransferase [Prochlorococcus marinus str. MIT 9215]|uniref:Glycosyltransferase n=1 Tax=Prochlorococcus marinus (strain MIT 9215) TaxID=93060 RepID=A8G641_PROM2|nr:glycosyltransferase [Prochlorococcus marinus]ABV51072.1 Glycosyltransferase [Prochlorococcus marinus str. MIT 9215]